MEELNIPSNFHSIIIDFTNDLSITFSEYNYLWEKWKNPELPKSDLKELFQFCVKVYPQYFFDILYQKDDIFDLNNESNGEFLPNVNFKLLFSCENVSEKTKKIIWKYLQLILFTIVGDIKDKSSFGDAANMFEGMNENELNEKLNETMNSLTDFFKNMEEMMSNIDKKSDNGIIQGLIIFDNQNIDNKAILFAKYGQLSMHNGNSVFHLSKGIRQAYDHNHRLTKLSFDSFIVEIVNNKPQQAEKLLDKKDINEYYIDELLRPNILLSESRKIKLIAEGHQRLIWPLYNFTFAFLAISIFLKQPYNKKSHIKHILLSALAVIIVTYFHFTLHNLASRNLDIILACYANLIISIIFSIFLCLRKTIGIN